MPPSFCDWKCPAWRGCQVCGDPALGGQRVGAQSCWACQWRLVLWGHEDPTGRHWKLPSTRNRAPPQGGPVPFPTQRQVGSPSPRTHRLYDSEAPWAGPKSCLAIPVCDALEMRVSQASVVYRTRFHAPLPLGASLPSPLPAAPPSSCLGAPPVSPACLGNPCLPVARETTSLATSRHPYDMYTQEGKDPASCLVCWRLCSDNPKKQLLPLTWAPGAQQGLRVGAAITAEREGKHPTSLDDHSIDDHSTVIKYLLFARFCAWPLRAI